MVGACAIVVIGATAAVASVAGSENHVSVAGRGETSTTTTTPQPSTSTNAPNPVATTVAGPPVVAGVTTTTVPTAPAAPGPSDFTGTIQLEWGGQELTTIAVGDAAGHDVESEVRNITDHTIWASDSNAATSLASVCTSETSGAQSLWWMTNVPMAPGTGSGRSGAFEPTDLYVGTVTCEVDIVSTDQRGTTFDTAAGGDEAPATIIAPVSAIAPYTFTVLPQSGTTTTTAVPSTTSVPDATTTTPAP